VVSSRRDSSAAPIAGRFRQRGRTSHGFGEAETALGGGTIARSLLLLVPLGIYYLCSLHVMAMWWPTSVDLAVTLSGLVIAALLLARWGLAATTVATLVRERRRCRDDT